MLNNQNIFLPFYSSLTIGPDKLNQARHVRFFNQVDLKDHMKRHADIIKPKFDLVINKLETQNFGKWTRPKGGYFLLFEPKGTWVFFGAHRSFQSTCCRILELRQKKV